VATHASVAVRNSLVGEGRWEVDGDRYELGPGDAIAFDSRLPHTILNDGDQVARAVWLVVSE
jgi:uncharacterized cupin superfamily protein